MFNINPNCIELIKQGKCKADYKCEKNSNCLFKNFQRKTAECEEIRNNLACEIQTRIYHMNKDLENRQRLQIATKALEEMLHAERNDTYKSLFLLAKQALERIKE